MGMMNNAPQVIDLVYDNRRHWFEVWRYTSDIELHAAIYKAGVRELDPKTVAYTDIYEKGEEAGRIYLLDTSIRTLAHEAVHMANGIMARHGYMGLEFTTGNAPELEEDFCSIVGQITSEMYSKSKFY